MMFHQRTEQTIEPMLLTAREAARSLRVCEKTLWTLTQRGEIPAVRIGRAVRYSLDDLKAWIQHASEKKCETPQNHA